MCARRLLQVYYYNTVTGDSAWEPPEGFAGAAAGAEGQASVPINSTPIKGTPWSEVLCSDGKTYYYNSATQVRHSETCLLLRHSDTSELPGLGALTKMSNVCCRDQSHGTQRIPEGLPRPCVLHLNARWLLAI